MGTVMQISNGFPGAVSNREAREREQVAEVARAVGLRGPSLADVCDPNHCVREARGLLEVYLREELGILDPQARLEEKIAELSLG